MNVAVFGLGKLGSPLAAFFASAGHTVIGYDKNPAFVEAINAGKAPVEETGLQSLVEQCGPRLVATADPREAVKRAEFVFVVVPTPSKMDGRFSTEYAEAAFREIGAAMKAALPIYRVVVLVSTVLPRQMRGDVIPAIAEAVGQQPGERYGVCYNPEFIALGNVLADLRNPSYILIGEHDARAGEALEKFYRETFAGLGSPPIFRMTLESAEVTKLGNNCAVTQKISYANMLAAVCEKIPYADAAVVLRAIGTDRRIGRSYLRPAVPYGGPCFPRDCRAMQAVGEAVGVGMLLCEETDEINHLWLAQYARAIYRRAPGKVCILGSAYKPNTKVREESFGVNLQACLRERYDIDATLFDPEDVPYSEATGALAAADVVVLAVECPEFAALDMHQLKPGAAVFDCWRQLDAGKFPDNPVIVPGKGPDA